MNCFAYRFFFVLFCLHFCKMMYVVFSEKFGRPCSMTTFSFYKKKKKYFLHSKLIRTKPKNNSWNSCFFVCLFAEKKLRSTPSVRITFHESREVCISGTLPQTPVTARGLEIFTPQLRIRRIDTKYLSLNIDDINFHRKILNMAHSEKTLPFVFRLYK